MTSKTELVKDSKSVVEPKLKVAEVFSELEMFVESRLKEAEEWAILKYDKAVSPEESIEFYARSKTIKTIKKALFKLDGHISEKYKKELKYRKEDKYPTKWMPMVEYIISMGCIKGWSNNQI